MRRKAVMARTLGFAAAGTAQGAGASVEQGSVGEGFCRLRSWAQAERQKAKISAVRRSMAEDCTLPGGECRLPKIKTVISARPRRRRYHSPGRGGWRRRR